MLFVNIYCCLNIRKKANELNISPCHLAFIVLLLLIISGSVHPNPGPDKDLTICHVNMRSLQPHDRSCKLDELYSKLCLEKEYDVICVSETWLDDSIPDSDVVLTDYQIFRKDRNRHGGGVAIYVHDALAVQNLADMDIDGLESKCLEIRIRSKNILIACIYRPPGQRSPDITDFLEKFQTLIDLMYVRSPQSIIIMGDFNDRCIKWDDSHLHSELGTQLKNLISNNIMFQMINDPTYVSQNYSSLLDLAITDSPGYILDSGVWYP